MGIQIILCVEADKKAETDAAIDFRKKGLILNVDPKKLVSRKAIKGTSNILSVVDKYLKMHKR